MSTQSVHSVVDRVPAEDYYGIRSIANLAVELDSRVSAIETNGVGGGGGGGSTTVADGSKGDITVSGTGTIWTVAAGSITYGKIQKVSASNRLLGRVSAGDGPIEEIVCNPVPRTLLDDSTVSEMQATLQLVPGTNVQAYSAELGNLSALAVTGLIARIGAQSYAARAITAGSSKVNVTNGNGVSGQPAIDVVESALGLNNIGGVLSLAKGGTGASTQAEAAAAILPSQTGNNGKVLTTDGVSVSWATSSGGIADGDKGDITVASGVWSVDARTITFGKIQAIATSKVLGRVSAGSGDIEQLSAGAGGLNVLAAADEAAVRALLSLVVGTNVQAYSAELAALAAISTTGLISRTGAGAFATRQITAGSSKITVANGGGASGQPTIDVAESALSLPNIGGTLTLAKGGTGATTQAGAANAVLPAQTGLSGKVLGTDGTNVSWVDGGSAGNIPISQVTGLQSALDAKLDNTAPGVATVGVITSNVTDSTASPVDATGLAIPLLANKLYDFAFDVIYSTDTTTTGIGFSLTGPTNSLLACNVEIGGAGTAVGFSYKYNGSLQAYNTLVMSGQVNAVGTKYIATVRGRIRTTADGTLQLKFRSEVAASVATIYADSSFTAVALA